MGLKQKLFESWGLADWIKKVGIFFVDLIFAGRSTPIQLLLIYCGFELWCLISTKTWFRSHQPLCPFCKFGRSRVNCTMDYSIVSWSSFRKYINGKYVDMHGSREFFPLDIRKYLFYAAARLGQRITPTEFLRPCTEELLPGKSRWPLGVWPATFIYTHLISMSGVKVDWGRLDLLEAWDVQENALCLCILQDHLRLHEYQGALEDVKQLLPLLDWLQGWLPSWINTSERVEHRMPDRQILISDAVCCGCHQ